MQDGYWQDKKVLITGGTGFIGSFLTKDLSDKGANVVCMSGSSQNGSNFKRLGLDKYIQVLSEDILDLEKVKRVVQDYNPTHIFHLAAQSIVARSVRQPAETLHVNLISTTNILEAMRTHQGIESLVVASSIGAYDPSAPLPFTEVSPLQGHSPYDVSKSCTDLMSQAYAKTYSLPVNIARFSNVFGEGDTNFDRLVPRTVKNLLEGKDIVIRYGGKPLRGFFYVHDAVSGLVTLAEKTKELSLKGQAFNFGPDNPISIGEFISLIIDTTGVKEPNIIKSDEGLNEVRDQYHSNIQAGAKLHWRNNYSLDHAMKRTVDWYREYLKTTS